MLGGADTLFCAAVIGAAIGGLFDYGSQVYQNYRGGYRGTAMFTHICVDELLIGMMSGAIGGGVGYIFGPITAAARASGLLGSIVWGAVEGEVAGGLSQIAGNTLSGRAWNTDLFSAGIGGGIAGGIGGGLGWVTKRVVQIIGFRGVGY